LEAPFFAAATRILLGRWNGFLVARVKGRNHSEALSSATHVAHAPPHVAQSRFSDISDCHCIRNHRLLPHAGFVAVAIFLVNGLSDVWHRSFYGLAS
jgi:hypothetical protein